MFQAYVSLYNLQAEKHFSPEYVEQRNKGEYSDY